METEAATSPEQTVRAMLEALDGQDIDRLRGFLADDGQGVDEISRGWFRTRDEIESYFSRIATSVRDIRSELSDVETREWDDTALVTFVLHQSYTADGQQQTVDAPTSIVLRRRDGGWKAVLVHSVPLPST